MADNTTFNAGSGGDTIGSDDIGGVKYERAKLIHGVDGTNNGDVAKANPLPVIITNTGRTELRFYAITSSLAAAETAVTITKSSDTSATTTGTSFVVTSGKRFKITGLSANTYAAVGSNNIVTVSIRINTSGAVTTTSTAIYQIRCPAYSPISTPGSNCDQWLPFDGIEIPGDGTLQWGVTTSAASGSASGLNLAITGYEY